MLEVRLLGQFDVRLNDQVAEIPSRPAQALFAYLILNPGIAHRREMLAGLLWPESTESNARSYLRHALWRIRQALGDDYLHVSNISIAYDPSLEYWLDVSLLERPLVKVASVEQLVEEVSVYKGDLLPGFYDEWIVPERERLHSVFEHKMDVLLSSLEQERRWPEILEWGERWTALGLAPEPAYRALMVAHGGMGNRAGVVVVYNRCVDTLWEEVGAEPSELTRSTYERLMSGAGPSHELVDLVERERRTALDFTSLQTTPFIGRQKELAEITGRLGDPSCRLLTLVGPGGIGKTRLALEAAGRHGKGACFVSLATITLPSLLLPTIAEALGLSFYGGQDSKARLLDYLRDREAFLILDNFEHLLEEAGLVAEILRTSQAVKILVTSRERLNLRGEWLYEVRGMDFPRDSEVGEIEGFSAIELFLQNARRLDPGFSLSDKNRPHVVRICQLVEGMPLAIELATAWVRILSPQEIADELAQSLDFLATSLRDVPARHQSLRAVFEHSWSLLSEAERTTFRRLSIFRGGFTREAARQVASASLLTLSSLADKSLVRWSPAGRYLIHHMLSQYCRELLRKHPEDWSAIGHLHCGYYAGFIQQRHNELKTGRQKEALQAIEREIDNLRAAWWWAVEHARTEDIAKALDGFYTFYLSRGWFEEGEESIGNATELLRELDQEGSEPTVKLTLAKALARQGSLCANLGLYEEAKSQLAEALALARALDAMEEVAFALNALGGIAWDLGEYLEAMQCHQESVAICRDIGHQQELVVSLDNLGFIYMCLGQFAEAKKLILESVEVAREIGDRMGIASPLGRLGWVAYVEGDLEKAQVYFGEAIAISQEFDNRMVMALDQAGLSVTLNALQEYGRAKQLASESLAAARDIGYQLAIVAALGSLGDALRAEGNYEQARACLNEGFKTAFRLGLMPMYLLLLIAWGSLLADEGESERATETLTLILQSASDVEVFGKVAELRLSELRTKLSPDVYAAARQRGERANLQRYVQDIAENG